jgi:hypothetical protein
MNKDPVLLTSIPTHAAPQYSVLVLPPDGTVGFGTVNVPETLVTPDVTIAAPAHCKFSESVTLNQGVSRHFASSIAHVEGLGSLKATERVIETGEVSGQGNKMLWEFAYI